MTDISCNQSWLQGDSNCRTSSSAGKYKRLDSGDTFCALKISAYHAAQNGQLEHLQHLVNVGVDVNTKDAKGNSLLAKGVAWPPIVEYLISHGADVNALDEEGNSVLMKAAADGHIESVQLILERKALLNYRNRYGFTALIQAVRYGKVSCVFPLLRRSVDVNVMDKAGYSALVHAAVKQSVDCVRLLLEAGATIDRNIYESMYCLLRTWESAIVDKQIILMLFAAGAERPKPNHRETSIYWKNLTDCLNPYGEETVQSSLAQTCRATIRKHLLLLNKATNLYASICKLKLPLLLHSYLLYDITFSK